MSQLRTLRIVSYEYRPKDTAMNCQDISKLFDVAPKLSAVHVSEGRTWPKQGNLVDTWERGNLSPIRTEWQKDAWKEA